MYLFVIIPVNVILGGAIFIFLFFILDLFGHTA